jgi:ankyrin repeat protein
MPDPADQLTHYLRGFENKFPRHLAASYPHVLREITEHWNDPAVMADYFSTLMIPNRPNRQGFPDAIAAEIITLSLAYDKIFSHNKVQSGDLWGEERAVKELGRLGIDPSMNNFTRAAEAGDSRLCMIFIGAGFDVDARDSRHWTPLMMAAFNGREALATELIRSGANVHAVDNRGYSPIHWAAFNGYPTVITLLASKTCNVNARSESGITPLLQAAARGHTEACVELINCGADPNLAANDGSTPLLKAVANNHLTIINLLLAADARLDAEMSNGKTLIDIARESRDPATYARITDALRDQEAYANDAENRLKITDINRKST